MRDGLDFGPKNGIWFPESCWFGIEVDCCLTALGWRILSLLGAGLGDSEYHYH